MPHEEAVIRVLKDVDVWGLVQELVNAVMEGTDILNNLDCSLYL